MNQKKKRKNPNKDEREYKYKQYLPEVYDDSPQGDAIRRIRSKTFRFKIDWEQFEKLCSFGFSKRDICIWFNVSDRTLEKRIKETFDMKFTQLYDRLSLEGDMKLTAMLWKAAGRGDMRAIQMLKEILDKKRNDDSYLKPQQQEHKKIKWEVKGAEGITQEEIKQLMQAHYDSPRDED